MFSFLLLFYMMIIFVFWHLNVKPFLSTNCNCPCSCCLIFSSDEWTNSARSNCSSDYRRPDFDTDRHRKGEERPYYGPRGRQSRSRDDLMDMERDRHYGGATKSRQEEYDDMFLRKAMEKNKIIKQEQAWSQEKTYPNCGPPPLPANPPAGHPCRQENLPSLAPLSYIEDKAKGKSNLSKVRKK